MAPGMFGEAFRESLRENRPEEYAAMSKDGSLEDSVEAVNERASAQYQNLRAQLDKQHPAPKDMPYPQKVTRMMGISQQARELVYNEILVRAPDDEDR